MQVFVDGKHKVLARTGTTCGANFWAQPQQSPSADGTCVLFHSNGTCAVGKIGQQSSGTIDLCILYRFCHCNLIRRISKTIITHVTCQIIAISCITS